MPASTRSLSAEAVSRFSRGSCFAPGSDARIGAEVEFFVLSRRDPVSHVPHDEVLRIVAGTTLTGCSRVTFEPGGQLEVVSPPRASLADAMTDLRADIRALHDAFLDGGLVLVGTGFDALRPERRVVGGPRYDAMEAYFDADGLSGRAMMCRTAAIQVNLDFGLEPSARWRRAHALGPVAAAAFANSPLYCGVPSGWRSTRLATWRAIDRTRTAPVGGDGPESWARYVLDARVMLMRETPERSVPVFERVTFDRWMRDGLAGTFPTMDDLAYHCSTLFPPVRPRGWLELRMSDALPDPWWQVPIAWWTALLYDDEAGDRAERAAAGTGDAWVAAARDALTVPALADAARASFDAVIPALVRMCADPATVGVVSAYADRYVRRGRTPADDLLAGETPSVVLAEVAWT